MISKARPNVDLILKNTDALSGTPKILMTQAFALSRAGHDVNVIAETFHPSLKNHPAIRCKKAFRWPQTNLFQRKFFDLQARRKTRRDAIVVGNGDTLRQDILNLHTCVHLGAEVAPGPHNLKNLSIPFHRMIFEQGSFREIICVSKLMRDDLQRRFDLRVPMHVIYPGHDADLRQKVAAAEVAKLRAQLKVASDEIVVGVVASGNLDNRGARALIESMGRIEERWKSKIKLLIVGKDGRPQRFSELAQAVGMGERLQWLAPREDVQNLISALDVVVYAAHIESAGITFLECLALGKPVIVTRTVGFAEILRGEQRDFIIDRQDAGLIAQGLDRLLADAQLRARLGELNAEVAGPMTWANYERNFMEFFANYCQTQKL